MAYKEKIIQKLEQLLKTEEAMNKLLRKQDIYLTLHPRFAREWASEIREEISHIINYTEQQQKDVKDLVASLKGDPQDVY